MADLAEFPYSFFLVICLSITMTSCKDKRISCESDYPCACKPIKVYAERAIIENRIDCRQRHLLTVPSMVRFRGYPISKILLQDNSIKKINKTTFDGLILANVHKASEDPIIALSSNPLGTLRGDEFRGIMASRLVLKLEMCSLKSLPEVNSPVGKVTIKLFLKNNLISEVPNGIMEKYPSLRLLDLSGNRQLRLYPNSFSGVEASLRLLYLENTDLTVIPSQALRHLYSLSHLHLGQNRIAQIEATALDGFLTNGLNLHLEDNAIVNISVEAFRRKPALPASFVLHSIYLDNNHLKDLDFVQDPCRLAVTNTSIIAVRKNPIRCDCELFNLTRLKVVEILGECAGPSQYAELSIDWRPYGTSPDINVDGGNYTDYMYFPLSAKSQCGDNRKKQHYDCMCDTWISYDVSSKQRGSCQQAMPAKRYLNNAAMASHYSHSCHYKWRLLLTLAVYCLILRRFQDT